MDAYQVNALVAEIKAEIDLVRASLNGGAPPCGLIYVHSRQVH